MTDLLTKYNEIIIDPPEMQFMVPNADTCKDIVFTAKVSGDYVDITWQENGNLRHSPNTYTLCEVIDFFTRGFWKEI